MRIVHICSVDKLILHTRIPVIKATARMLKENAGTGQREIISLPIDISIDSPAHRYESSLTFSSFYTLSMILACLRKGSWVNWRLSQINHCNFSQTRHFSEIVSDFYNRICPLNISGIATTELARTLVDTLPPLGPAVILLKEFLKSKGLNNPYTGGMSTYGILLLALMPLLKKLRDLHLERGSQNSSSRVPSRTNSGSAPSVRWIFEPYRRW